MKPSKKIVSPHKLARDQLEQRLLKVRNDFFFFRKIKCLGDLLSSYGYTKEYLSRFFPSELVQPITNVELDSFMSDRRIELSTKQWLDNNKPKNEWSIHDTEASEESVLRLHAADTNDIQQQQHITTKDVNDKSSSKENVKGTDNATTQDEYESDYGLEPSAKENVSLYYFQKKYAKIGLDFIKQGKRAIAIIAKPGDGKTLMAGAVLRRLIDQDFAAKKKALTPWPYFYITASSVVEQIKTDFREYFNLSEDDVMVVGIDQLRSKFGQLFLKEKTFIKNGVEKWGYEWRKGLHPFVIFWDESQKLKNERSTQSIIAQSFNDIPPETYTLQVHSSATPGVTVSNFKVFAVGTRVMWHGKPLTNEMWPSFAQEMCDGFTVTTKEGATVPAQPQDYCPAATRRLMEYLKDYIIRVKGVRSQFHAHNSVRLIEFQNDAEKNRYNTAVETMMIKLAKVHGNDRLTAGEIRLAEITILLYFRMEAELIKAPYLAKRMWMAVQGCDPDVPGLLAAMAAVNFKQTITAIVKILVNDYNVPRKQIALIWGGGKVISKKARTKAALMSNPEVMAELEKEGLSMEDLALDLVEAKQEEEVDVALRLGVQSKEVRQEEIMRYQSGKALYCLYTFKAGGTGLSLPHTDRFTKEKVRRKKSGYAFIEDIPLISTRPRRMFASSTWSPIEIIQGFGRGPRIVSLSDTYQEMIYYVNTVEERVAKRASMALVCVGEVVKGGYVTQRESWEPLIIGRELTKYERAGGNNEEMEEGTDGYFEDDNEKD